ncbi:MAG: hypothetical protein AAF702_02055 [Chloroflexota bacterium]
MISIVTLAFLFVGISTSHAAAHGEGGLLRLSNESVGSNYLHVWTSPAIARTGEIHVEALVTGNGFQPSGNQRVIVKVTPLQGDGQPMRMMASGKPTSSPSEQIAQRQEVGFFIEQPGEYEVEITVLAAEGQGGRHRFYMEVVAVNGWMKLLMQGMFAMLVFAGGCLLLQGVKLVQTNQYRRDYYVSDNFA